MAEDQVMNEDGETPKVDDMELGELDLPALSEAVKKGEMNNIPLHQLDMLAELYNFMSKEKQVLKQAEKENQE